MGLKPLEFADCLTDSPYFRTKLAEHERELERTSKFIKTLVHHGRDVYNAAKQFSKAQKAFAKDLMDFKFECIGDQLTDDENFISQSLCEFGKFIERIEEHRDILVSAAEDQFVKPLENFRKENIGAAKEEKKNFDKQTAKFCQSQERYLNMKTKINDSTLQEADTQVEFEKKAFYTSSMKYVLKLQEVQDKKKFEFVEILLSYMLGWLTFYHQGYVDLEDFRNYDHELRQLLQKTRENFECTRDEAQILMSKMLNENKGLLHAAQWKPLDQSGTLKGFARQGYLYLMEKKALGTTSWTKYYCQYKKETKEFYMILYNQMGGKMNEPERYVLDNCVRRASDTIEKRFCFDVTVKEKTEDSWHTHGDGTRTFPSSVLKSPARQKNSKERSGPMTFQALSDDDRKLWLDAMDGKEPTYTLHNIKTEDSMLDDIGFTFIKRSVAAIEARGLQEQGLYRVVGVNSKVNNLLKVALDPKKSEKVNYDDPSVWETKTVTSAVKSYLRNLPEPLMTFKLHENFIKAAKQDSKTLRILDVHKYVHQLPESNFEMLDILIGHLRRVADVSEQNKMTVANLGVCFGPSLMRPEEESMAAIMDIKFYNIVVEILINNYDQIFKTPPDGADLSESRVLPRNNQTTQRNTPSQGSTNHSEPQSRPVSSAAALGRSPNPSMAQTSRIYANQAPVHPNAAAARAKIRPVQIYNANTGGFEVHNSTSSSTESLNSAKSNLSPRALAGGVSPSAVDKPGGVRRGSNQKDSQQTYANVNAIGEDPLKQWDLARLCPARGVWSKLKGASKFNMMSGSDSPAFGSVKKRSSNDFSNLPGGMSTSMQGSLTGSVTSIGSSSKPPGRTVITRYRCEADNEMELSFEANQLITNVRPSRERGWLEGTLNGKTGIIPENYVEYIN
ncbi:rho GTPase-activating protein 26 isoform X4 [Aplysia californica]|uniref:Rho GTPase-activating protein 26 isoform X4 n=1 Tax=Aplysia californica TaxID=6500 RepID=A0ABM1VSC3_APLCA|nr:rho GTPase-activating protein 26 isoform X4 [Aplysia californica]